MREPQSQLITVEEFAAMRQDDDWTEELLDGAVHRSPPGYAHHGIACAHLSWVVWDYCRVRQFGRATIGSGLIVARSPDSVLAPDIQLFAASRPPDTSKGWPSIPPVFVAEVIDRPSDVSHVMSKVPLYLKFGIDLVWVVRPEIGVESHSLAEQPKPLDRAQWNVAGYLNCVLKGPNDTLDGGDVLPGFRARYRICSADGRSCNRPSHRPLTPSSARILSSRVCLERRVL
jgi:hypothetical protein